MDSGDIITEGQITTICRVHLHKILAIFRAY